MEVNPLQALHRASEAGDLTDVLTALTDGLHVDSPDHDNNTALHIASANGHESLVAALLDHNADHERTNSLGWTPLMQAARHGHREVVVVLLRAGAKVDRQNKLGMTALMLASVSGHMGTIRELIDAGADYNPSPSIATCQVTPLMIAAHHGNDAVVNLYLDKGVSANTSAQETGVTPLMFSAAGGNLSTSQILLSRGADPNALSACDFTALDAATICNRPGIINCLQGRTCRRNKKKGVLYDIMEASRCGDIRSLREILLTDPSQCEPPTADGATPLMVAAMMGNLEVAQILIQHGAQVDAQDYRNGWTALMQAIYHRQRRMVKFLVQCGADIYKATHLGYTAYDFASELLDTDMIQVFAEAQLKLLPSESLSSITDPARKSPDRAHKLPLKHWWNRVSNKFTRVRHHQGKHHQVSPPPSLELDSGVDLTLERLPSIHYEPILPQEIQLPPVMEFGGNHMHVYETLKSMVPPLISSADIRPNLASKAMRPGRKIVPIGSVDYPRHATNSRLLRWSMGSGVSSLGCSSLTVLSNSPQSSGNTRSLGGQSRMKEEHVDQIHHNFLKQNMTEVLMSSLNSESSGNSLKTVTSSKSSESSQSTATLVAADASVDGGSGTQQVSSLIPAAAASLTLSTCSGQLVEVMHQLSLHQYLDLFVEQEVDFDAFLELSDADLQDLGITSSTARHTILAASASLRDNLSPS